MADDYDIGGARGRDTENPGRQRLLQDFFSPPPAGQQSKSESLPEHPARARSRSRSRRRYTKKKSDMPDCDSCAPTNHKKEVLNSSTIKSKTEFKSQLRAAHHRKNCETEPTILTPRHTKRPDGDRVSQVVNQVPMSNPIIRNMQIKTTKEVSSCKTDPNFNGHEMYSRKDECSAGPFNSPGNTDQGKRKEKQNNRLVRKKKSVPEENVTTPCSPTRYLARVQIQRNITDEERHVVGKYVQDVVFGKKFKSSVESVNRIETMCYVMIAFSSSEEMHHALDCAREKNIPLINVGSFTDTDQARRTRILAHHVQGIEEKAEKILKEHGKKIHDTNERIARFDDRELNRTELVELGALQDKNNELQDQKDTFQRFLQHICEKLKRIESIDNKSDETLVQELRREFGLECHKLLAALPMYGRKEELLNIVKSCQVCIVLAETGSGKSTQMVQYLQQAGFGQGKLIACTQPRKVAAISLAKHVATEMGSNLGGLVGYQVGMQTRRSKNTQVMYMTDHTLLNECLNDRSLSSYSCIIIDEAHERSLHTDLLLGILKQCLATRHDLKIIITSATINPDIFVRYFGGCPVLKVSGRLFPVDVVWRQPHETASDDYLSEAVKKAMEIHKSNADGDILVFLTSGLETERACTLMQGMSGSSDITCLQLHGKLQPDEQQLVFVPPDAGKRKIVFATNCAETSITIPGIKAVVDTGMVKEMTYDPKRNMKSLQLSMINKSSAEQRKGRAGRMEAGTCYRLYTEKEYEEISDFSPPEILRVHLGHALLTLMKLGIDNPLAFDFVESPSADALTNAMQSLEDLQAVVDGKLTDIGKKMATLPVDPRLGKVILRGIDEGIGFEAVVVAALCTIAGNVFFRAGSDESKLSADKLKVRFCHHRGDIITLLGVFKEWKSVPKKKKVPTATLR